MFKIKEDTKMHIIDALALFSVLCTYKELGSRLCYYELSNWETPSFSPIYLKPGFELECSDIDTIESHFKQNPILNTAIKQTPYCLVSLLSSEQNERCWDICNRRGWTIENVPLRINLLTNKIPLVLPEDITLTVFNDEEIPDDYKLLLREGFHADDQCLQNIARMLYGREDIRSFVILLYNKERHCVGGGSISIRQGYGFMTWGTVGAEFRRHGYHNLLLSSCKMLADSYGSYFCGYTTRNPYIADKCDQSFSLYICRKEKNCAI
jgi:hypothetical protein